jgi:hypothetical protein
MKGLPIHCRRNQPGDADGGRTTLAISNRDMHLLARIVLEPRASASDPRSFQRLVEAGYAERTILAASAVGMVTEAGVAALDDWLGRDAFLDTELGLTETQARVLQIIQDRIAATGICPSRRVIARDAGIAVSQAQQVVVALEQRGRVIRLKGRARSLAVIGARYAEPAASEARS